MSKCLLKRLVLGIAALSGTVFSTYGQIASPYFGGSPSATASSGSEVCSIVYSYDAAGNRIKREYSCTKTRTPGDNEVWNESVIFTNIYPNPTTGVFTGEFSETLSEASFIITAMDGAVILEHELTQPANSITFDISPQVPGNYLLTVWALGREESYTITKNQ